MWNSVFSGVSSAVVSAWQWFDTLFDSIAGSWPFVEVTIVIFLISRFVLGPLIGFNGAGKSDSVKAKKKSSSKEE